MNKIIENNIESLKELCKRFDIKVMHIFGSAASDTMDSDSDIDILIRFKELDFGDYTDNYFNLCNKLEELFRRRVDLITDRSLSNPYFIESVEKSKVLIYEA